MNRQRIYRSVCYAVLLFSSSVFGQERSPDISEPFVFTPERIELAKRNAELFDWAKLEVDGLMKRADEAVRQSPSNLDAWFGKTTPTNQCSCPHCDAYWLNYIWDWSPKNPDEIVCNRCDTKIDVDTYPENAVVNRSDPEGNAIPHPVYKDEDGNIFPIRQLIAYYKSLHAYDWIESLGEAYALSANESYAITASRLLNRLATTYSSYAWHDNFRFEQNPWGWAGKLSGWHMNDAKILTQCAKTYDAIRRSPSLNEKQRSHIEENLFRLGGKMLTAVRPLQGISNDGAYRYGGVAIIGRLLQDDDILSWVLNDKDGYAVYIDKLFYEDGAWHERSLSYHDMLCESLYLAPYYLDGYKGIRLRDIPKLQDIYSLPFRMRFPDGTLPPVNDSRWGEKPRSSAIEGMYALSGADKWLAYLNETYAGELESNGSRFALFNRPSDIRERLGVSNVDVSVPENSEDFTGMGLFMLRRGVGDKRSVFTLHHHKYANTHSHYDALSVILFADGREMLCDIGYPLFGVRQRTTWHTASLSHNTLTVDTMNQRAPNGVANFLHDGDLFTASEAESWDSYRFICEPFMRQIALVDTDDGQPYAVDVFRGGGGNIHDWALHGEGSAFDIDEVELNAVEHFEGKDYAYEEVSDVRTGKTSDSWQASWGWDDGALLNVHMAEQADSQVFVTQSPGQRLREQHDRKIHSLFVRREGENIRSAFAAAYDPSRNGTIIKSIERMEESSEADWALVLKVELEGATDYILTSYIDIAPLGKHFVDGNVDIPWESRFGIVRVKNGKIVRTEWVHAKSEGLAHDI